jgi:hypothetical protein
MSKTKHALYVQVAAALALASAFALSFAADAPKAESVSAPNRYVREGIVIEFSVAAAKEAKGGELMEGQFADLRFKLTDEASGQPLRGNNPGAWLDIGSHIQGQPGAEVKSCRDKVALYMRGIVGLRPMLDLNSYYVAVLNHDASISISIRWCRSRKRRARSRASRSPGRAPTG